MPATSYRDIFKASSLIGGTQIVVLLIRMFRAKALAVLVGAGGTGLVGLYSSTTDIVSVVAGLGIKSSGVRQIAAAGAQGGDYGLARPLKVLRWSVRLTGLFGGALMLLFCRPLAQATFGDTSYAGGVALMGFVVVFNELAAGQWALLQGLRRIKDLAKSKIIGTFLGACVSILCLWLWRERGIIPYLITASIISMLLSWWFARRIPTPKISLSQHEIISEARALVALGGAFVVSGLVATGTPYLARIIIVRDFGPSGVGLFGAAMALSTLFVGFVLQAMSSDFYPRLVAAAHNHGRLNQLVNEQTEMVLLMAMPGILLIFVLAPWLLRLLYTSEFVGAALLLRWLIMGMALKIVAWPMGFIQLAKSRKDLFVGTEIGYGVFYVITLFIAVSKFGLAGAGVATVVAYAAIVIVYYCLGHSMCGFAWSSATLLTIAGMLLSTLMLISAMYIGNGPLALILPLAVVVIVCFISGIRLFRLLRLKSESVIGE